MSISWLENFLDRACRPNYYRTHSRLSIQKEFERAALDETLVLINKKIAYLELRRKDIVFIEIIESTVRRKPLNFNCKFRIPRNCPFAQARMIGAAASPYHHGMGRAQAVRASDPYPVSVIDAGKNRGQGKETLRIQDTSIVLDSKTMMLENESKIQWYKKLRNSVRSAVHARKRLFSALYRIPNEIWGQIFIFCLPSVDSDLSDNLTGSDSDSRYLEPAQNTAPLLLCGVCHTWRSAATQTPQLWNSLTIHLRGQTTRVPFLKTWIGRSGALLLDLHILWGPTQSLQHHDHAFDFLFTLAQRWRCLRLSAVRGFVWQAHGFPTRACRLLEHTMPALEELELESYPSLKVASLQRNAPHLCALRLVNTGLNPMHLMTSSPWAHLTVLRSPYPLDTSHALKVFKLCPALVECELTVASTCAAVGVARTTPLRMPCLRRLVVNETAPPVVDAFFRLLELPRLEEMRICAMESWESWTVRELLLLVRRTAEDSRVGNRGLSGGLKKLEIRGLNCDECNVKSLVFGIPSLFSLDVKNKDLELRGHSWVKLLRTIRRDVK